MRLLERKTTRQSQVRELPAVLQRLREVRAQHADAGKAVADAEQAEAETKSVTSDEFHGVIAPDEAMRRRAEAEQAAVEARRRCDHFAELAEVGEEEVLRLIDAAHESRERARTEKVDAALRDRADAQARALGAEARLQRLADEQFDAERAHIDARSLVRSRERRDWQQEDNELIRRFVENVRHQAGGNDDLPPRLRDRAAERIARLQSEGVSREYLQEVADRSGYTLLDPNGGPVRMPER